MHYYEQLLGADFARLHPKLQQRYSEPLGQTQRVEGVMHVVENGSPFITPLLMLAQPTKFMFHNVGRGVPFVLQTTSKQVGHTIEVEWTRAFYFDEATRYYNTRMVIDTKMKTVLDYNGDGKFFASTMDIRVTEDGALYMKSVAQHICIGSRKVPLPKRLQGVGMAIEAFDEHTEQLTISVHVYNPLIGTLKQYRGTYDVML